jgi:hypothetical protein
MSTTGGAQGKDCTRRMCTTKGYVRVKNCVTLHVLSSSLPGHVCRVLARIIFQRTKKHIATTMTRRLGKIFLVKCQKQAFSFNKREAKVYCYAFLHVLERYMHKT